MAILFIDATYVTLYAPLFTWNVVRLSTTFAAWYGYELYPGLNSGAILNNIYGPLAAYAYLPAVCARTPSEAIIIAAILAFLYSMLPVLWFLAAEDSRNPDRIYLLAVFACFYFSPLYSNLPNFVFICVHADAPARALGALSCAFLYFRRQKDAVRPFLLSSVFVVLAIWTKQVMTPLVIALPVYVLLTAGWGCFKRYAMCLVVSGLVISALFLWLFDSKLLFFNMITIPSRHPYWLNLAKFKNLLIVTQELLRLCIIPLGIIIGYCIYQIKLMLSCTPDKKKQFLAHDVFL